MQITGMILGWVLLGQAPELPPLPRSPGTEMPGRRSLPPANLSPMAAPPASTAAGRRPTRAAELVADAVRLPADAPLAGQPLGLLDVLSPTPDRRAEAEIVRAYWRVFEAVAGYRFALEYDKSVSSLRGRGSEEALLRAAREAAAAQLRQSELDAARAQYELAGLLRRPAAAPLPLCADRPYVGGYETRFKEQFAARTPPEPARLADKTLPLQRQVIDGRAEAVQAAEDAILAVSEDYQSGRSDAAAVAACSRELLRQQQAFIHAACDYNRNIADYVFLVVPLAYGPQDLVGCLIGPAQAGPGGGQRQPVQPAGASPPTAANPVPPREPTLARRPRPTSRRPPRPATVGGGPQSRLPPRHWALKCPAFCRRRGQRTSRPCRPASPVTRPRCGPSS